jgi:hypothetical protein
MVPRGGGMTLDWEHAMDVGEQRYFIVNKYSGWEFIYCIRAASLPTNQFVSCSASQQLLLSNRDHHLGMFSGTLRKISVCNTFVCGTEILVEYLLFDS